MTARRRPGCGVPGAAYGFSLIELLVACALLLIVSGAVAALAGPLLTALERTDRGADLEPAGRAALAALVAELREAGVDAAVADPQIRLARVLPRVRPMRDLDSDETQIPGGAVRLTQTATGGAQAILRVPAAGGETLLQIDTIARCAGGPPSCGFRDGTRAIVYAAEGAHPVTITAVAAGQVTIDPVLPQGFGVGTVVAEVVITTYGLRPTGDGSAQLVRISSGGAEQPVLDHVVDFAVATDVDDLFRAQSASVRVRIEAGTPVLRGPAGYLFRRGGAATSARQWLPDVELRFTVALRNPAGLL